MEREGCRWDHAFLEGMSKKGSEGGREVIGAVSYFGWSCFVFFSNTCGV